MENSPLNETSMNNSASGQNKTIDGWPLFYQEHPALRSFRLVLLTIIFMVGVLGNCLVCFVTSRKRGQTSTGNLLILHLAIADLGILMVNFPFVVVRSEFPYSWPFGRFICRTVYPFGDIFYGVEIGCITAIAFHRYKMLVHCTKPQIKVQTAKKIVSIIWFISFIFIVVPMIFVMELKHSNNVLDCGPLWPNKVSEQIFSVNACLMFYVVPLTVILVTYIKIKATLKANTRRQNSYRLNRTASSRASETRLSQNRRAIQILTPVLVMFAISMLPFTAFRFFATFGSNEVIASFKYTRLIFNICCLLLISNSAVNPIVYSVVNSEFRREFSNHLKCGSDNCCLDTTEGFTTVQKTENAGKDKGPALPVVGQSCAVFTRVSRQNVGGGLLLTNPDEEIEKSAEPSRCQIYAIKINPTYETGGF